MPPLSKPMPLSTAPWTVRVTAAEAAELRERAQAARLSMGAYLRRRALGQRVRMAAELRLGAAELRELNRIGVNLNQMARALNSGAVSSPGLVLGHSGTPSTQVVSETTVPSSKRRTQRPCRSPCT